MFRDYFSLHYFSVTFERGGLSNALSYPFPVASPKSINGASLPKLHITATGEILQYDA